MVETTSYVTIRAEPLRAVVRAIVTSAGSSPREAEFQLLASSLRDIAREIIPNLTASDPKPRPAPEPAEGSG